MKKIFLNAIIFSLLFITFNVTANANSQPVDIFTENDIYNNANSPSNGQTDAEIFGVSIQVKIIRAHVDCFSSGSGCTIVTVVITLSNNKILFQPEGFGSERNNQVFEGFDFKIDESDDVIYHVPTQPLIWDSEQNGFIMDYYN